MHIVNVCVMAVMLLVPAQAPARGRLAAACRGDVQRLCAGLAPGRGRIARCLEEHATELSEPCRQAMAALRARRGRGPTGAARSMCRNDVMRLCPDAVGDMEKIRQCLRTHSAGLSDGCKNALTARRQRRDRPPAR